jgi:membrane associated rhomboid family serine protease
MNLTPGPFIKVIAVINIALAALMLIPSLADPMIVAGGLFPARFTEGDAAFAESYLLPFWFTPVSSAFLHGGILHVGLNMLMLLVISPSLERVLGWKALAILYSTGIFAAALAELLLTFNPMVPVIGASGPISALIASYAQLFPNEKQKPLGFLPPRWAHAIKLFLGWGAIQAMFWFVGPALGLNLAIWAHMGGFAAGLALTWPLMMWRYRKA